MRSVDVGRGVMRWSESAGARWTCCRDMRERPVASVTHEHPKLEQSHSDQVDRAMSEV